MNNGTTSKQARGNGKAITTLPTNASRICKSNLNLKPTKKMKTSPSPPYNAPQNKKASVSSQAKTGSKKSGGKN